jgi:hypothetical protein
MNKIKNYFNIMTDSYGYPIEHEIGRPISSWIRHAVQLFRKWINV